VDLNPAGFTNSGANATNGTQQVGGGTTGGVDHALLWTGTAASVVDLHPAGFVSSGAAGTNGSQQVGSGVLASNFAHALRWAGTAASAVDMNPSGFNNSYAQGTSGIQQVGFGDGSATGGQTHALLWTGTAASAVDLNPSGFTASQAYSTNGTQQVGFGDLPSNHSHALLWSGTAASVIDLHALLPAGGSWTDSSATTIDANGNIFGGAIGTFNNVTGSFVVEWSPVPEPGTAVLLAVGGIALASRMRSRKSGKSLTG
jgi:hypothetical protein